MKKAQKIIKYLAIALGLYLAINIIGWIIFMFTMLLGIDKAKDIFNGDESKLVQYSKTFMDIEDLDIDIAFADFEIREGEELKVEGTIHKDYKIEVENKTLKIERKTKVWNFNINDGSKITLYVPNEVVLDDVKIDVGAGNTKIEQITAEEIDFNFGAGNVNIQNCKADKSNIECGAGNVTIEDSSIEDLRLEAGVGEVSYNGYLLGESTIECGVGKVTLDLEGGEELYSIEADHGIGAISVNGEKIEDKRTKGNGENKIKIEGGIGEIKIKM